MVAVPVVAGVLVWAGATLLLDACWRPREDLASRLARHRPVSVADEAQERLSRR